MTQITDISDRSRIRCHKADVAVAVVPGGEKVLSREALPSGIHSHREQAAEVGSQGLIQNRQVHCPDRNSRRAEETCHRNYRIHQGVDHRVCLTVCHCSPVDCSQSVCIRSRIHSHCRNH